MFGVPTFDALDRFWADYRRLTYAQRERFLRARDLFVEDLQAGVGFRKSLRIKGFRGEPGVFEMTWAGDGRALFRYGESEKDGEAHIVWLRVGTHDIFDRP
ncbi:hypothetical protein [Frankia sp. CiP3]|uniref:hypothetical protein n=1 Tax=Frankia sp. CiP3 TaxID=2880971 RepID=UPI001EF57765|nr:hypothetical protein [Frankia sp. CiP3]